ncbi:hypothetical protein GCM10010276_56870 [Streptomyces longisporus]|uniref:Secreted protein n=1 Tax=Streptomyces longisporus TaxID=1948 RepID=A0ABP5ZY87_STRLO
MVTVWALVAEAGAAKLVPAVASPPTASPTTAAALTRVLAKAFDRMRVPLGSWCVVPGRDCGAGGEGRHGCRASDVVAGRPTR